MEQVQLETIAYWREEAKGQRRRKLTALETPALNHGIVGSTLYPWGDLIYVTADKGRECHGPAF